MLFREKLSPFIFLITLLSSLPTSFSQKLNVSLLQPMELAQDNSTITTITNDYMTGTFIIVTFSNLQLRKYKSDFSSFTNISLPEIVEKDKYINTTGNIPLLNTGSPPQNTSCYINSYTTLSNNSTTMRVYNITTLTQLDQYTHTSAVDDWDADVVIVNGQTSIYFTFYNTAGAFSYSNGVLTQINQTYPRWPLFCRQRIVYVEYGLMINSAPSYYYFGHTRYGICTDNLNTNVYFYLLRKYSIDVNTNLLVMTPQLKFSSTNTFFPNVANIVFKNGMDASFYLQDTSGTLKCMKNNNLYSFLPSPYWSTNPILAAKSTSTSTILIHTDSIIEASFTNNSFNYLSTITSFTNFSYAFSTGRSFDILFQPKISSKIYKISMCLGNSDLSYDFVNNVLKCSAYNCTSSNCISCPINRKLCRQCIAGSTLLPSNYSCTDITPNNTTNTTNNTTLNNSTSSNTTSNNTSNNTTTNNSTSNNSISNSTNINNNTNNDTANSTNNTSNTTNNISNNTSTNSSNNTNSNNNNNSNNNPISPYNSTDPFSPDLDNAYLAYLDQLQFLSFLLQLFNSLLTFLTQLMKETIKYPLARKVISSLFYYFGNFQDLFFYQFHDRTYSSSMNNLFQQISSIQYQKWELLSIKQILEKVGVNPQRVTNLTDYQSQYLSFKYFTHNHLETGSEGLLSNSLNYFLVTIPITLCAFLLGRLLFFLSFKYSVSQLFRKFDFWAFFIILLLEGNIQQFAFYMAAEWRQVFFFESSQKMLKFSILMFGFSLYVVSFGSFFFFLSLYRKLNRYLLDNNKNMLMGVCLYLLQNYIRNFIMGVLNSYLRFLPYQTMVKILVLTDLTFGCFFLAYLDSRLFITKAKVWIYLTLNLQKVLLLITFLLDNANTDNPLIDSVQQYIILFFIAIFGTGMANELLHTIYETGKMVYSFITKRFCLQGNSALKAKTHIFEQQFQNIFTLPQKFVEKLSNQKILRVEQIERRPSNKISTNNQVDKFIQVVGKRNPPDSGQEDKIKIERQDQEVFM